MREGEREKEREKEMKCRPPQPSDRYLQKMDKSLLTLWNLILTMRGVLAERKVELTE